MHSARESIDREDQIEEKDEGWTSLRTPNALLIGMPNSSSEKSNERKDEDQVLRQEPPKPYAEIND